MNPECPRCSLRAIAKTSDGREWTCEAGHFWAADGVPLTPPKIVDPDALAIGLRAHLRAAAREYLERLVKELA